MRLLITGATGLVGSKIRELCRERAIGINYLTHSKSKPENLPGYRGFYWNPKQGEIDVNCLDGVTAVINLAGANLFKLWTKKYKKTILDSRVNSLELLYKTLQNNSHQIQQIVSASAVGVYPSSLHKMYSESDAIAASSFLIDTIKKWEAAADRFSNLGMEVAKLRTGMVLGKKGGAFPIMKLPIKYYIGAPLGSGKQWQSWIHITDIARLYLFAVEHNLEGVYNAVAPIPVNNKEMTFVIAKHLKKWIWIPKIPGFLIKAVMGEMGNIALSSQLVSNKKVEGMGYKYQYSNINKAVGELEQSSKGNGQVY